MIYSGLLKPSLSRFPTSSWASPEIYDNSLVCPRGTVALRRLQEIRRPTRTFVSPAPSCVRATAYLRKVGVHRPPLLRLNRPSTENPTHLCQPLRPPIPQGPLCRVVVGCQRQFCEGTRSRSSDVDRASKGDTTTILAVGTLARERGALMSRRRRTADWLGLIYGGLLRPSSSRFRASSARSMTTR